jgi:integrase/recombinase XerD
MTALAPTLQAFFCDRLIKQRAASPNTIAAYRDTFRLLIAYTTDHTNTDPSDLDIGQLDATLIGGFLHHLETERHNSPSTRNTRLAAIRSFYKYAAHQHPEHAETIQRVLTIPQKRTDRATVSFLTRPETEALLAAPDTDTWCGRRDHTILTVMTQTGLKHQPRPLPARHRHPRLPQCGKHNRWKQKGFRIQRTPDGKWHTTRPDGSQLE